MQNTYLEIMASAEALVAKATAFSTAAEDVSKLLLTHKSDLEDLQGTIGERFKEIRTILAADEASFNERFNTLKGELDHAIAAINGIESPKAEPPVEPPSAGEAAHG